MARRLGPWMHLLGVIRQLSIPYNCFSTLTLDHGTALATCGLQSYSCQWHRQQHVYHQQQEQQTARPASLVFHRIVFNTWPVLPAVNNGVAGSGTSSSVNGNINSSRPLYRGNLSGPGNDTRPTTAMTPEDMRAATQAENAAAAASVASASKPVVKFVPKRISLFGGRETRPEGLLLH